MQRRIRYLSWTALNNYCRVIQKRLKDAQVLKHVTQVVGVPRGGLPVALWFSHHLNKPMSEHNPLTHAFPDGGAGVLICEDIVDSGHTLMLLREKNPNALMVALVAPYPTPGFLSKENPLRYCRFAGVGNAGNTWWVFPWEDGVKARAEMAKYNTKMKRASKPRKGE
jgi:hypoxanthine phosphoribosyltransferase